MSPTKEDNGVYTLKPVAKTIATGTFNTAISGLCNLPSEPKEHHERVVRMPSDFNLTLIRPAFR